MSDATVKETLGFQAEVKQLLHLMVHSLYGNKEIFLRELISNASDACDKLRFEALADQSLWESDPNLKIQVSIDKAARTVTVSDNGVGMSREEVIHNIGTIAKSGTREFFQRLTGDQAKDANLIGQFGVGFYSSFIVADKVTLITRRAGMGVEHGVRWESDGQGDYTLETRHEIGHLISPDGLQTSALTPPHVGTDGSRRARVVIRPILPNPREGFDPPSICVLHVTSSRGRWSSKMGGWRRGSPWQRCGPSTSAAVWPRTNWPVTG